MSLQSLSAAASARLGSIPFSNLAEASVLRPSFLEVVLTLLPRKFADSMITVFVSSWISELRPPITPATAMLLSASLIMSMSPSRVLSFSSRVTNFSPGLAFSTMILPPWTSLMSKACIGWPYSSITKLVKSTMLFIGLMPAYMRRFCSHQGDCLITTSVAILAT